MTTRVFAPAKINLTLKVGMPRADARHPLASVVAFANIGDWVEAESADDVSLSVVGPFADALRDEADNLALRAARALAQRFHVQSGARLTLEKNLPVASGIGGGSSDAAAALKALVQVWAIEASPADLHDIAATLGADVPVCMLARSAFMTGAGEVFAPLAVPSLHAILVNPLKPLATRRVYAAFDAQGLGEPVSAAAPVWRDAREALAGMAALGNDLAAPASAIMPEIGEILTMLRADSRVLYAALSGSGATCFAVCDGPADITALCVEIRRQRPDWWVADAVLGAA